MPDDPTDGAAESSVVLQLTGRSSGVSRVDLYDAVSEFTAERIDTAVIALEAAGVARATPQRVYPSAALQRLDSLGLICVWMGRPEQEIVRFAPQEHRFLSDLAAAEGTSLESLIRQALTLPPYEPEPPRAKLATVSRLAL